MNAVRWKPLSNQAVIISPETGDDMRTINNKLAAEAVDELLRK